MQPLTRCFTTLLDQFELHGVVFLVIGSYASAALSTPRYVKDLDLWLERSADNARRVLDALHAYGFTDLGLTVDDFNSDTVIELGYPPVLVDLMAMPQLKTFAFADEYARRVEVTIDGTRFPLAHRDYHLGIKRLTKRVQDREDLLLLEQSSNHTIEQRIREIERLRRLDIAATGDPDRPLPRAVRRKQLTGQR